MTAFAISECRNEHRSRRMPALHSDLAADPTRSRGEPAALEYTHVRGSGGVLGTLGEPALVRDMWVASVSE